MGNTSATLRSFWLTILLFTFIINLAMLRLTYLRQVELKSDLTHSAWSGVIALCLLIAVACAWLAVQIARDHPSTLNLFDRLDRFHSTNLAWRIAGGIVFLAVLYLIPYIKFAFQIGQDVKTPIYDPVLLLLAYYWLCWWLVLIAMTALKLAFQTSWLGGFASALVILAVAYEVMTRFNAVTDYPLSMGWSEGSRYYYASLIFSKQIYGESFPLSTLHPTRYLLQAIPFLIPGLSLYAHRLWQFLLWIVLTSCAAIAITQRIFSNNEKGLHWLTAGWIFMFLLRVGVYYHLEVMVILPLLFMSAKKPWQSLLTVIVASVWAGMSRVNWFPIPAMLAIAIYLLETPLTSGASIKQIARYLTQPVLWTIAGLASALLGQFAYISLSGNAGNAEAFISSFTSDLLWYRLWPNANFSLGIIPAILIISGPLIITFILAMRQWKSLHAIRWLGLITMMIALFAGSAVVSTKIGGGGDLHNMDTYAVLIGVVGCYFFSGHVQAELDQPSVKIRSVPVYAVALVTPLLILIPMLRPYPQFNHDKDQTAYQQLVQVVNEIGKNGPVLFINDRQAVALGEVKVPLVYDYEVVTLMEMAMSGNQPYLNRFYNDLQTHRFAAIVATKQNIGIKQDGVFAEENNVWNTDVSPYILCYYESNLTIEADDSRLEIYTPRAQPGDCPLESQTQ